MTEQEKRLFVIAHSIATEHARGWFFGLRFARMIRLRTTILQALKDVYQGRA